MLVTTTHCRFGNVRQNTMGIQKKSSLFHLKSKIKLNLQCILFFTKLKPCSWLSIRSHEGYYLFVCIACSAPFLWLLHRSKMKQESRPSRPVAEPGKYRELLPKYRHTPTSESKGKESDDKGMMGKGETTGRTSSQGSTTIAFFKNSYSTTLL